MFLILVYEHHWLKWIGLLQSADPVREMIRRSHGVGVDIDVPLVHLRLIIEREFLQHSTRQYSIAES